MGQIGISSGTGMTGFAQATSSPHRLCTGSGSSYTPSSDEQAYQLNIRTATATGTAVQIGRSSGAALISTPQMTSWLPSNWGTTWHKFRMKAKFNSGTDASNEVADGEFYLEIDDVVWVDAKNLFNRHYSNLPIKKVELFGWSQSRPADFELWYDDVRISTGGFV